jgi:hypothetical protein
MLRSSASPPQAQPFEGSTRPALSWSVSGSGPIRTTSAARPFAIEVMRGPGQCAEEPGRRFTLLAKLSILIVNTDRVIPDNRLSHLLRNRPESG